MKYLFSERLELSAMDGNTSTESFSLDPKCH